MTFDRNYPRPRLQMDGTTVRVMLGPCDCREPRGPAGGVCGACGGAILDNFEKAHRMTEVERARFEMQQE
jgi:hypothetical protein